MFWPENSILAIENNFFIGIRIVYHYKIVVHVLFLLGSQFLTCKIKPGLLAVRVIQNIF